MEIEGKTILEYILERISVSKLANQIIVCTSDQTSDDPIIEFCKEKQIDWFRGSLDNVSRRFLNCAEYFQLDYAVRVNGDNLFTDANLIDHAIELANEGDYDFVSNVDQRTFPTGMSVEVIRTKTYQSFYSEIETQPDWREHVTLYFYQNTKSFKILFFYNTSLPAARGYKLALDTMEDFEKAKKIIHQLNGLLPSHSWEEIVTLSLKNV